MANAPRLTEKQWTMGFPVWYSGANATQRFRRAPRLHAGIQEEAPGEVLQGLRPCNSCESAGCFVWGSRTDYYYRRSVGEGSRSVLLLRSDGVHWQVPRFGHRPSNTAALGWPEHGSKSSCLLSFVQCVEVSGGFALEMGA